MFHKFICWSYIELIVWNTTRNNILEANRLSAEFLTYLDTR